MKSTGDATARDPRQIYITLREDLHVSLQHYQGKPYYLLEDPQEIQFFRVGIAEGTFLSMLDGRTSLDEALRQSALCLGKEAFSEAEAMQIIHWLLESKLARPSGMISIEQQKDETPSQKNRFNPLAIRLPLLHPDHFFADALPWCEWSFGSAAFGVWVCAFLAAVWQLISYWNSFSNELQTIIAPKNWPSLMIAWVFLKVLHESAHGLVCKKYGGIISEMGIMILWGMPIPYVDVTSSWSFRSKRQRIFTAVAGMYAELFIASLAMLLWLQTGPGWLHYWCVHLVVIAGVSSVVFNGNPLMRFDGYYALMDMLEIPNLYGFGMQFWQSVRGKIFSGIPIVLPGVNRRQCQIIACYGLLAAIWRCVVYLSLTILGFAIFPLDESHLIWYVLFFFAVVAIWRFGKSYRRPSPREKPSLVRHVLVGIAICLVAGLALLGFSTPFKITSPAIVEYKDFQVIRNYSPGFVREIDVSSRQPVKAGQVIALLANEQLDYELADISREIEISQANLRTWQHKDSMGELKAEQDKLEALQKQHDEKQTQVARLVIRAPADGIILTRHPEILVGRYLSAGSEVVSLGDEHSKDLRISVDQDDMDAFSAQIGKPIWIRMGGTVLLSVLSRIEPRASMEPLHPALTAVKGGSLPVKRKNKDTQDKKDESGSESYELLSPQFVAKVILPLAQSDLLAAGQRVQVSFSPQGQSMGDFLFSRFQRWCRDKVRRMRSAWNL